MATHKAAILLIRIIKPSILLLIPTMKGTNIMFVFLSFRFFRFFFSIDENLLNSSHPVKFFFSNRFDLHSAFISLDITAFSQTLKIYKYVLTLSPIFLFNVTCKKIE